MTKPFFYIVQHKTGVKYAGIKFARGCSPDDLWTTYFTSSKKVHALLEEDPNSFSIVEVTEFDCRESLIAHEVSFLKSVNAPYSDDWLNLAVGKAVNPDAVKATCLEKYGVDSWMKTPDAKGLGFKEGNTYGCFERSEETRKRMSEAFKGRVFSDSHKKAISDSRRGIKASLEARKKMSETRQRGDHPRAVRVQTPDGIFPCQNDAADFYGKSSAWVRKRCKNHNYPDFLLIRSNP